MTAPSVGLLENAANATFWGTTTTAFNLSEMKGANGAPLQVATPNGCTAAAFRDGAGNVIITFQGTQTAQQSLADLELMSGAKASGIPAFQDALTFAKSVAMSAASLGISSSHIFVTGHSLGGTLAEYVASQTGLGGASFAGSGVPGLKASATAGSNFVSYVERGDAFSNWSTDGSEHALIAAGTNQSHYGQLVFLGPASNDSLTNTIISDCQALGPAMLDGQFLQAALKLSTDFTNNLLGIHGMNVYQSDIADLPPPSFASSANDLQASIASPTGIFNGNAS